MPKEPHSLKWSFEHHQPMTWPNLTWYSQSNTSELHQPIDELGVFLLTSPNPKHISETKQNSTNPWMSWTFALTLPNPEYGEFNTTELYQPWVGRLLWPNLTLDDEFHTSELHQPMDEFGVCHNLT
jgi:hypothetical protein